MEIHRKREIRIIRTLEELKTDTALDLRLVLGHFKLTEDTLEEITQWVWSLYSDHQTQQGLNPKRKPKTGSGPKVNTQTTTSTPSPSNNSDYEEVLSELKLKYGPMAEEKRDNSNPGIWEREDHHKKENSNQATTLIIPKFQNTLLNKTQKKPEDE